MFSKLFISLFYIPSAFVNLNNFFTTDEYERLKALEESVALAEHSNIYHSIEERNNTPLSEYVSMDEMAKKFDIDLEEL